MQARGSIGAVVRRVPMWEGIVKREGYPGGAGVMRMEKVEGRHHCEREVPMRIKVVKAKGGNHRLYTTGEALVLGRAMVGGLPFL